MNDGATNSGRDDAPLATSKHGDPAGETGGRIRNTAGDQIMARAVTINRPRAELYAYWRDFANLATFMENVERIDVTDDRRSHWVVAAPAGKSVEWDAIVTEDRPDALIAWETAPGADVPNSGRIEFADAQGGRGTVVTATILYDPPAGIVGKIVAKLFQREPAIQARRDLRRFKQLMETGEISTNAMNPAQAAAKEA
ncbi:SRPBCC family protein [Sphingomonas montana]|uniref:SRPBCC family protein n=1 Tax=Sphingomonas montana TaxID=1843236 RepID=UPI00096E5974|nr:SRPBCC family protein [Sphingomonas montana]